MDNDEVNKNYNPKECASDKDVNLSNFAGRTIYFEYSKDFIDYKCKFW